MTKSELSKYLEACQSLPAEQQAIMRILAVFHGYSSMINLGNCLFSLGIKKEGKELTWKVLKIHLKPLLAAGLVEEAKKSGGVRCRPALAEVIARQLVAENLFERYAAVITQHNPTGIGYHTYLSEEQCLREARLAFYLGDGQRLNESLSKGRRLLSNFPAGSDILLSWFLNPLDIEWCRRYQPTMLEGLLEYCALHQLLYLYALPEITAALSRHCEQTREIEPGFLTRVAMELQLLRGEWAAVKSQLEERQDPELMAISATVRFLEGGYGEAVARFDKALSLLRKTAGQRGAYFYGLAGVFYPLAIWKSGDLKQRAKLSTLLGGAIKNRTYWSDIYQLLDQFLQISQGNRALRDVLLDTDIPYEISNGLAPDGIPRTVMVRPLLLQVFVLLIKYWVKADDYRFVPGQSRKLYSHLQANGYRWPAAELAKVFSAIEPDNAESWDKSFFAGGRGALADLFVSQPDWELALESLANLGKSSRKSDAPDEKSSRLVWLLHFDQGRQHLRIEPREQKQRAGHGWSKGRAIAMKRLAQAADSLDYLSDFDRKLCARIKVYRNNGWYHGGETYDFAADLPLALIGHPQIFWHHAPEVRVEIVRGEAELRVKKRSKGGKINISLVPLPASEQKFHIVKEAPTRLKVVEFTAKHQELAGILGSKGLDVPLSAQDRVLQTLTDISGLLTVHSDIGGSSSTAEQIVADATPRLHLLPLGAGLRVALLIRPFATGGAYYQPGNGGESVLAEIAGKALQARRDLALEKQRAEAVMTGCPSLRLAVREEAGDWLLAKPEECLELLLQVEALAPGEVVLEWPEGVRFKLLGKSSGSGFTMRIKQDTDWFSLQGELRLDEGTVIEVGQLLGLLQNSRGRFVQLREGQFFALTDEFRRRLDELKTYAEISGKKVRINPLAALALEDWQDDPGFKGDKHWRAHLEKLKDARAYQPRVASTFQAELRDYQREGYNWLARLAHWGVGACLADDLGLGKTVQGLALLVERAPEGPALIIAPTSVCMNWESESARFAPTLKPLPLGNGDRQQLLDQLGPYDLLICSYGLLQQEQVAAMLAQIHFRTIILDEAQAIKNTATRRSQGAMALQADFKLIMTGTPLENHLGELWNLFHFINPGLLGSLDRFNQRFAVPIERDNDPDARRQLKKLIQPFILRRTKTQVLQELPPRTEIPMLVELSGEELVFYEALRRQSLEDLKNSDGPPGQQQLQILAAITRLRRSCCNSRLVNGDIALPSSKLEVFGTIVDELLANNHKALVFSQFVDHLRLIREYIEQRGILYRYLDGSTPAKERQRQVEAFQRGDGELFLISLKAGGLGLNLTAADYVIHMDPWWNPAVEDQASDRAHRIGQQRPVTIYRLIAKHTIEEKIVALHSHKRDLADSLLEGAELSGKISADDLLNLMRADGG